MTSQPEDLKLLNAVRLNNEKALRGYLTNQNCDIVDENGFSLLANAVCSILFPPNLAIVRMLLEMGANVNKPFSKEQWTPLHHAAHFDNLELVNLLLEFDADVNAIDGGGNTPLIQFLLGPGKNRQVARTLIIHGAKLDHFPGVSISVLDWAERLGKQSLVES